MANETRNLTEMSKKLKNDSSGQYRDEILEKLSGHMTEIKHAMDAGLPPDEFRLASKLKEALEAASGVVKKTWDLYHGSL